jgi:hypothetical protein
MYYEYADPYIYARPGKICLIKFCLNLLCSCQLLQYNNGQLFELRDPDIPREEPMTRSEVTEQITARRKENQFFIKSWETGQTFVDFDLIERFISRQGHERPLEGFELLDMEQMWNALIQLDPDKLQRVKRGENEIIEWLWQDKDGVEKKTVYPFDPEGIMTIIDDEFFA